MLLNELSSHADTGSARYEAAQSIMANYVNEDSDKRLDFPQDILEQLQTETATPESVTSKCFEAAASFIYKVTDCAVTLSA